MRYIVGAYAASPTSASWDPAEETDYLNQVAGLSGFRGLELPFAGALHQDEDWLLGGLDPAWDLVLTAIPGTVGRNKTDPQFGLASSSREGRLAALGFTADLRSAVQRINDRTGRRSVLAVELHSAPSNAASAAAFARSLEEIADWDWDGVALTVEHCDAMRTGRQSQKGYLSLTDELAIIEQLEGVAGITLNWGRSAIEGRSAVTALEHVELVTAAGALTGLVFSGVGHRPGPFGEPWLDAHLPPSPGTDPRYADLTSTEATSLLGPAEIGQALDAAAGKAGFVGVKIGVRPLGLPVGQRVAYLRDAMTLIDRARSFAPAPPAES